tara:strand:+ start:1330 stop:2148 length:819 start_codon:yes stop_codon:yes gene_type:complete
MPELPEVETTIRYLDKKVNGKKIFSIKKSSKKLRKNLKTSDLKLIKGSLIKKIKRFAKYIIIELNTKRYLIIHLGMSGRLKYYKKKFFEKELHDHVILEFNNFNIVFNDPRRFGMFFLLKNDLDLNLFFQNYGVDLLTSQVDVKYFFKLFKKKKISLKQVLLDQRIFVGIGNIYANEALFHSKLKPTRLTNSLSLREIDILIKSCRYVLKLSLKNGGSSINDYKSPDGTLGSFQSMFSVYQKSYVIWNKKSYPIKKIIQNGRSTFFSPSLQK